MALSLSISSVLAPLNEPSLFRLTLLPWANLICTAFFSDWSDVLILKCFGEAAKAGAAEVLTTAVNKITDKKTAKNRLNKRFIWSDHLLITE
jgi:hypothetical protein